MKENYAIGDCKKQCLNNVKYLEYNSNKGLYYLIK